MDDKVVNIAMEIILNAGDARSLIQEAFSSACKKDFPNAKEKLAQAERKLNEAHIAQTDVIQRAVRGEEIEMNLLLIHAQDTIMTINSEYIMAEQMLQLVESILDDNKKGSDEYEECTIKRVS